MLGHDEEVSGSGAAAGVALLKERGVSPVMALDEGFMAVEDNPLTGGTLAFIGVAEKGYVTLQLTVTAEGGHSSTPPRNSATVRLSRAMVALDVALDTEDTVTGVVIISGLLWPFLHRDLAQDLATTSDRPRSSPPFSLCLRVLSDCASLPCLLFWRSSASWIRSAE